MKTCTIIPIHPPHFEWGYALLNSYIKFVQQPHDLYFVFTNEDDANSFKKGCDNLNYYKELVLPNILRSRNSIVNVKKYFGLFSLKNEYDYMGVFDSESQFVKNCNLDEVYSDIVKKKYLKANKSTVGNGIIKHIAEQLKLNYNKNLLIQTDFYSCYWWFNEIPVYRSDYFEEFINWFYSLENSNELQDDYYCFDFLVYSIWLICFKNLKLKILETPFEFECGAVEEFRAPSDIKDKVAKIFDSYWSTDLDNHTNYEKIKLIFQTDGIK
jgi:hypothetical protein